MVSSPLVCLTTSFTDLCPDQRDDGTEHDVSLQDG